MIRLTTDNPLGPLLRSLRLSAGLTVRQLAERAHLTRSGISKREARDVTAIVTLVEHLDALGYDLFVARREDA